MEKLLELKEFLLEKKYYVIGGVIFLLLLGCSSYFCFQKLNDNKKEEVVFFEEEKNELKQEEIVEEKIECYVSVDIKGEVTTPGLYKVKCESRVQDVINEAGGITDNGDTSILNLSKKVSDEMVIIVYSKEEMADITINEDITNITITKEEEHTKIESCDNKTEIKNDACITKDNLLDSIIENNDNTNSEIIGDTPVKVLVSINTASKEELMTLSGIGESKANNIINYRNEVGRFNSIDEIKNVKGIGDSIFEKIKDSITV